MRKVMVLAAMLAMMLVAAAPAFAQTVTGGDFNLQVVNASQSVTTDVTQSGTATSVGGFATATSGDATLGGASGATASADSDASVSNTADISVDQFNGGLGGLWWWFF